MESIINSSAIFNMKNIIDSIVVCFPDVDPSQLTGSTRFSEIPGWDSMNSVNLLIDLESRLGDGVELTFVITGDDTLGSVEERLRKSGYDS